MEEIQVFIVDIGTIKKLSPSSPTVLERHGCALARAATVLAGIRAGGINLGRLPKRVFRTLSGNDQSGIKEMRPLTVAGAAQVRFAWLSFTLLLPVELRRVNHDASTNAAILVLYYRIPFFAGGSIAKSGLSEAFGGTISTLCVVQILT